MYFKPKPVYNMLLDNMCLVFFTASKYNYIQVITMIQITIQKLMKDNNISRYKLQQLTNWNYKRINAIYFSEVKQLTLEEMEKLCSIFNCNIQDIINIEK